MIKDTEKSIKDFINDELKRQFHKECYDLAVKIKKNRRVTSNPQPKDEHREAKLMAVTYKFKAEILKGRMKSNISDEFFENINNILNAASLFARRQEYVKAEKELAWATYQCGTDIESVWKQLNKES